jgi:hypothetical protein
MAVAVLDETQLHATGDPVEGALLDIGDLDRNTRVLQITG